MSMGPPAPTHTHASYPNDPVKSSIYASSVAGTSSIPHYDPYAPPRRPSGSLAPVPSSSSSGPKPPGFYTIIILQWRCADVYIQSFDLRIHLFSQSTRLCPGSLSARVKHVLLILLRPHGILTIYLSRVNQCDWSSTTISYIHINSRTKRKVEDRRVITTYAKFERLTPSDCLWCLDRNISFDCSVLLLYFTQELVRSERILFHVSWNFLPRAKFAWITPSLLPIWKDSRKSQARHLRPTLVNMRELPML